MLGRALARIRSSALSGRMHVTERQLIICLFVLQVVAAVSCLVNYTTLNVIFYAIVTVLTYINLFGKTSHMIAMGMWSICTFYLLWKVRFIGAVLAVLEIVSYVILYYGRVNSYTSGHRGGNNSNGAGQRNSPRTIPWRIEEKDGTYSFPEGIIMSIKPLMWCRLPQFWRRIEFVNNHGIISVIDYNWFHRAKHNLSQCCDPDYRNTFWNWALRTQTVVINRHGEKELKFTVEKDAADRLVLEQIDLLIQWTCEKQGVKRIGHA